MRHVRSLNDVLKDDGGSCVGVKILVIIKGLHPTGTTKSVEVFVEDVGRKRKVHDQLAKPHQVRFAGKDALAKNDKSGISMKRQESKGKMVS
jgi:hypothetical protein